MSWPARDASTYRCDRCGRPHGAADGCYGTRAPYVSGQHSAAPAGPGPYATGPHAPYSTGAQAVYSTGQHGTYATGPQAAYATGPQPGYVTGPHAPYATGPQPGYVTGPHTPYATGPHARVPYATGPHPPAQPTPPGYLGHSARGGRHPLAQPQVPAPASLDWTGQLGGWSAGVAQGRLDTTGRNAERPHLLHDERADRDERDRDQREARGRDPRLSGSWPSVTTDPFGTNAQAADRAARRERSRNASFGFPLHTHTPRRARRHTVEFAEYWGLNALVEAAEVVVSELMTNALEASLPGQGRRGVSSMVSPLELRLTAEGSHLRIEIRDHIPDPPVLVEDPDVDDERGRGLILVDNYCEVWGYHRLSTGGKVVWCLIGPPSDA